MANGSSTSSSSGSVRTDVMLARLCIAACTMLGGCMTAAQNDESDLRARREEMVEQQIRQRGVTDARVLEAMRVGAARALRAVRAQGSGLRGRTAADRVRPDDLAALHRRLHDRGAGRRAVTQGPRGRDGLRIPGRGPERARSRGVHHRDRPRAGAPRRRGVAGPEARPTFTCAPAMAMRAGRSRPRSIASW